MTCWNEKRATQAGSETIRPNLEKTHNNEDLKNDSRAGGGTWKGEAATEVKFRRKETLKERREGRMKDAWALGGEEGRDKPR